MRLLAVLLLTMMAPIAVYSQSEKFIIPNGHMTPVREYYKVVYEIKDQDELTPELETQLLTEVDFNALDLLRKDHEAVEIYLESIQKTLVMYPRIEANSRRDAMEYNKMPKH